MTEINMLTVKLTFQTLEQRESVPTINS